MESAVSFPENWNAPQELRQALPRETHISGQGMVTVVLWLVLLAAAVFLYFVFHHEAASRQAQNDQLRTEGREASGEIARLWRTGGKSSENMVEYFFTADGVRIRGETSVPGRYWAGIQKAGFLPIRYLPSNPAINHPAAWGWPVTPLWAQLLGPGLIVAVSLLFPSRLWRQAKLAAEGVAAAGVVTRCSATRRGWWTRYQFRTKDGALVAGGYKSGRRFAPGATVCVLYLADHPRRNSIYPLALYRVAQ